jgi:pre-mRNA-processing factor 6
MKSAMVEREAGDAGAERGLLQEGIRRFPAFWKLHIMLGQLEERLGAHALFCLVCISRGEGPPEWASAAGPSTISSCPSCCCANADGTCPPAAGNVDAARLAYAAGIKRCLDCVPLWVSAARLEERAGNVAKARALLEQVGARA